MSREPEPVLERPGRRVQSYTTGRHLPNPYFDGDRTPARPDATGLLATARELVVRSANVLAALWLTGFAASLALAVGARILGARAR